MAETAITNLQPLCRSCNNRDDKKHPYTRMPKPYFENKGDVKYIDRPTLIKEKERKKAKLSVGISSALKKEEKGEKLSDKQKKKLKKYRNAKKWLNKNYPDQEERFGVNNIREYQQEIFDIKARNILGISRKRRREFKEDTKFETKMDEVEEPKKKRIKLDREEP